ncbi:MAG: T9SS type A sorting domain-containing protein [Bacteroidetes bacterium]|nr:T9SS type A sorting domain-containing protein [Bacteroidota bacterium]
MKKIFTNSFLAFLILFLFLAFTPEGQKSPKLRSSYVVLGFNDLGMHCANKTFAKMCILPPYNNQFAHVIKVGDASNLPEVQPAGSGVYVTYEVPGNTYSVGKTDFWTYANTLFGVTLAPNIGLTGRGMTGTMHDTLNYFDAYGIPITPFTDANLVTEDPYQLTLLKAYDAGNNLLATTQNTIPVSNDISCVSSGCHSSEQDILNEHEYYPAFSSPPVFCATCHPDPALNMNSGSAGYFSKVIHQKHGSITNNCYKCHPGTNTQCLRGYMKIIGKTCTDCHGSVSNVGNTIASGRVPWVNEPKCGDCHDANHSENPGTLYKLSKGHGGLFCEACHNSTHAEVTSENANDNLQNLTLQGYTGPLKKCEVCHGYIPAGPGPHGYNPLGIRPVSEKIPNATEILPNYPNPCSFMTNIPYTIQEEGTVRIDVYDLSGNKITTLMNDRLKPGEYKAELYTGKLSSGTYICQLVTNGSTCQRKILVIK